MYGILLWQSEMTKREQAKLKLKEATKQSCVYATTGQPDWAFPQPTWIQKLLYNRIYLVNMNTDCIRQSWVGPRCWHSRSKRDLGPTGKIWRWVEYLKMDWIFEDGLNMKWRFVDMKKKRSLTAKASYKTVHKSDLILVWNIYISRFM